MTICKVCGQKLALYRKADICPACYTRKHELDIRREAIKECIDILKDMKDCDYMTWVHSNYSLLSENQWDCLIEKFKERVNSSTSL